MFEATTTAVGMDISDRKSNICVIDETGEVSERAIIRSTPLGMRKYFGGRPRLNVAIETGPHTKWIYAVLTELGHEVAVANARKFRAIYENENKDDDVDAETLARIRRADPKLLYPVVMKTDDNYSAMATLRARDRMVQVRTKLINAVRGMVKSTGNRIESCDADYFHRRRDKLPQELSVSRTSDGLYREAHPGDPWAREGRSAPVRGCLSRDRAPAADQWRRARDRIDVPPGRG
jgi:transposase